MVPLLIVGVVAVVALWGWKSSHSGDYNPSTGGECDGVADGDGGDSVDGDS